MNAMSKKNSRWSRTATVGLALLSILMVGGSVIAAGGVDAVIEWFATAKLQHSDGTSEYVEMSEDGMIRINDTQSIQLIPLDRDMESLRDQQITIPINDDHRLRTRLGKPPL